MSKSNAVAIVGAGPVGLVCALLLRQRGFSPTVFERRATTSQYPAAHVVNTRTLEVFDELGVARTVEEHGAAISDMPNIVWCESLAGREYGKLAMRSAEAAGIARRRRVAAFLPTNIAQNRLEPLLLARLREFGGAVEFEHEVRAVALDDVGVELAVLDHRKGSESWRRFEYVIGCDGAGSPVRRALGIAMQGPRTLARFLTIYFEADLDREAVARKALLFWIGGAQVRGFVISFDYERTWALLCPIGDHPADAFSPEAVKGLVRKMIGEAAVPFTITGTASWNMSAQIAERYSGGRVYLAGDAAHRFPPTGGLGMNTGVQDAQNLIWKIAAVLDGHAPDTLLHTYERERRGIAQRNSEQSVQNLMRMSEIDNALGFPMLAPIDPADGLGPLVIRSASEVGMDDESPPSLAKRGIVQSAIDAQSEHFDDSLGLELGFSYEEGAIVRDDTPTPPLSNRDYHPDARPGSRLPHVVLRQASGTEKSTLQLVKPAGLTLYSGHAGWLDGAKGEPLMTAVGIGPGLEFEDPSHNWKSIFGIDATGAVLVRPDGHVAWRSRGAAALDARAELQSALRGVLGWASS